MATSREHRVKKLEQKEPKNNNLVTKITRQFINPDGTVHSSMVTELVNGVWIER